MLSDLNVHIKLKLAALWTAIMVLYLYGDLFGFFRTDLMKDVVSGNAGWIGTQSGLLVSAAIVALPTIMIVFSLVLRARPNRYANIVMAILYTGIVLVTVPGSWAYYTFLSVLESLLTLTIVWHAWRWPTRAALDV